MRNIEFRGLAAKECRTKKNSWKFGCYITTLHSHTGHAIVPPDGFGSSSVDSETVGQFTGLLDKNGTKIFEGDILKIKYTSCTGDVHFYDPKEVRWIDEACGFNISHGIDCEIIGNIHEAKQ